MKTLISMLLVLAAATGGTTVAYAKGKPPLPPKPAKAAKVSICHKTKAPGHPFVKLALPAKAVAKHLAHGDVLPDAVTGECPTAVSPPVEEEEASPTETPKTNGPPPPSPM